MTYTTEVDDRDAAIILARAQKLLSNNEPQVGDWVIFSDGTERRISHVWGECGPNAEDLLQTSVGGHFYMGDGYVSYSGSLFRGISSDTLTDTNETRQGAVWIFHHDYHTAHNAHNGIDVMVPFRVWTTTAEATR